MSARRSDPQLSLAGRNRSRPRSHGGDTHRRGLLAYHGHSLTREPVGSHSAVTGFICVKTVFSAMTVSVLSTYVESIERIQPNQANNYGNTHGGEVVRLMDELAAVAAMSVANETCVTARIGSVDFRNPIPVGHVAEISAYVYETGTSSLKVRVNVEGHDPRNDEAVPTTSACFTLVAVDGDGEPLEVPTVVPESERGQTLVETAPC